MNARATRVAYNLFFRTAKLKADMEKLARAERRSLNELINIACEEFIERRTAR